jgi:hypothetical protein
MANKFSGVLTDLFPSNGKRWYEFLKDKFNTFNSMTHNWEGFTDDYIKVIPNFWDSQNWEKQLKKHGLRPGDPIQGIVSLLREEITARYSNRDTPYGLPGNIHSPSGYYQSLSDMEAFLAWNGQMVTRKVWLLGSEPSSAHTYSSASNDTQLRQAEILIYEDEYETLSDLDKVINIILEHGELKRVLTQYADDRFGEARKILGSEEGHYSYRDPRDPVEYLLAKTSFSLEEARELLEQTTQAQKAMEIIVRVLEQPKPDALGNRELLDDRAPIIAVNPSDKLLGLKTAQESNLLRNLAKQILERL